VCFEEGREELDRVDKVLLIFPLLPAADLLSTLFSLGFGGEEVGIFARPILKNYGAIGLMTLAVSGSVIFLVFMEIVIHIKKLFRRELSLRRMWYVLAVPVYWFFMLEGVYVSTIVMNFLVPFSPLLTQIFISRALVICIYFVGVSALTMSQMRQPPHL